jgi:predicted DNA-binding transcriptional regulator YafY
MDKNFPRLLATLQLIPAYRKITAHEVQYNLSSLGHTVDIRTVQRDLKALSEYYDIESDDAKPLGWRWKTGTASPVIAQMGTTEAIAFDLLERQCKALMPPLVTEAMKPWFARARTTLKQSSHTKAAHWPDKVATRTQNPPLLPATPSRAVLEAVSQALFADQKITGQYRSAQQAKSRTVTLNPLGLVQTGLATYLVATFQGFTDPRLLALHRLQKVSIKDQHVEKPTGFNLEAYLGTDKLNFGSGKSIELTLRMTTAASLHLQDTPLSNSQVIKPEHNNTHQIVTATVSDSPRLLWWILGFGNQVEVLAPESLRTAAQDKMTFVAHDKS